MGIRTGTKPIDDDILFRWNETDLTQFTGDGASPNLGDTFSTPPILSVATSRRGWPTLQMQAKAAGSAVAGWSAKPSAIKGALPARYVIEYVCELASSPSDDGLLRPGVMLACDDVDQGLAMASFVDTNNSRSARFPSGGSPLTVSSLTGRQVGPGTDGSLNVCAFVSMVVGSPPVFYCDFANWNSNSGAGGQVANDGAVAEFGALEASFNNWTPTTVGLFLWGAAASTVDDICQISSLIVRKHPMDV
jgi:hypothetical protein